MSDLQWVVVVCNCSQQRLFGLLVLVLKELHLPKEIKIRSSPFLGKIWFFKKYVLYVVFSNIKVYNKRLGL